MNRWLAELRKATYNTTFLYTIRMIIIFGGTAFVPYFLGNQILTIPLSLAVVAAGLGDIDDRFSVRIMNMIYTYVGFFITATAVQLLSPYPIVFASGLIVACIGWILLGSLGRRYASISYGCLVVTVYAMLGVDLFEPWYVQPTLLVCGAAWYGLISTISFLLFPIRQVQDQLSHCYSSLGDFLFAKSNLFDVDMTSPSYQRSMVSLSLENSNLIGMFNEMRTTLLTRLKGDRGRHDTRRSLQYYFVAQDIHERADSSHFDYLKLAKIFEHSDIMFRFQRIFSLQGKACKDLSDSILHGTYYHHSSDFEQSFQNLRISLEKLRNTQLYDLVWINALWSLFQNLKAIDAQLNNIETEQHIKHEKDKHIDHQLNDDDLKGWSDIVIRVKQNLTPESILFRHAIRLSTVLFVGYILVEITDIPSGFWVLLTSVFVCLPNFNATKRRLHLRILGTFIGVIVGYAILYFIPSLVGQLLILTVSGALFLVIRSKQYAQATAFITILALINFNFDGVGYEAALPRLFDTIVGCVLAWLGVTFIFPDWKFRNLPRSIQRSLQSQCEYLSEVIKQYREGRNNSLNYRLVRRAANNTDAEIASLISTLETEPNYDPTHKALAFEFLCLNHTFLSYIAALGAHREQIEDAEILNLLDRTFEDIQAVLLRDETPDETALNVLKTVQQRLAQSEENSSKLLIIVQQISLMFSILQQFNTLKQTLSDEQNQTA
ncbi:TIGR01666 family membrane protein [Acinetobacter sp. ANC 4470]|uniref:YccS family putative transporter n=1 Tax=Acinetobacter sp. ANC 4470 TaxID=1977881 RepID=UPI000A351A30|nr:YccS family putative transporter [Acinetobacter sp. ANC 4470]OTG69310.1 TIGR01666 family membrane protein [Acinetobacter sp. ANC 4470]